MGAPLVIAILSALIGALVWLLIHLVRTHVPNAVKLRQWAEKKGFDILAAERRLVLKGPFFGSRWEPVYRIRIRDKEGQEKIGWICFENFFNGSGTVTKWDGIKRKVVEWDRTETRRTRHLGRWPWL